MHLSSLTQTDSTLEPLRPQEISELARSYGRQVFAAAYRILGDPDQAEDVQQDVFLRLIEKPMGRVESWPALLTTLAVRMAIDRLRRRKRWQRLRPLWRAGVATTAISAEDDAAQIEKAERLLRAIGRLKPREAECFTLRCVHGLDIGAIAAATGMTANHVSVCLHRATRMLESLLGDAAKPTPEILP